MDSKLSRRQVESVLRRAAEIDAAHPGTDAAAESGDLSVDDVRRLGDEAGLRPDAVTTAIAELRRGALVEPETGALARALGSSHVVVSREVPGPAAPVRRAVDRFLRDQLMVVRRHHGDRVEWERAHGIWPGLVRSLALSSRYAFGPVSRVETVVTEEEAGRTAVTFSIDLSEAQKEGLTRMVFRAAAAFAAVGLGGAALLPGLAWDAVAIGAGGLLAGGVLALERRRFARSRDRATVAPERFLDLLIQRRGRADAG